MPERATFFNPAFIRAKLIETGHPELIRAASHAELKTFTYDQVLHHRGIDEDAKPNQMVFILPDPGKEKHYYYLEFEKTTGAIVMARAIDGFRSLDDQLTHNIIKRDQRHGTFLHNEISHLDLHAGHVVFKDGSTKRLEAFIRRNTFDHSQSLVVANAEQVAASHRILHETDDGWENKTVEILRRFPINDPVSTRVGRIGEGEGAWEVVQGVYDPYLSQFIAMWRYADEKEAYQCVFLMFGDYLPDEILGMDEDYNVIQDLDPEIPNVRDVFFHSTLPKNDFSPLRSPREIPPCLKEVVERVLSGRF